MFNLLNFPHNLEDMMDEDRNSEQSHLPSPHKQTRCTNGAMEEQNEKKSFQANKPGKEVTMKQQQEK